MKRLKIPEPKPHLIRGRGPDLRTRMNRIKDTGLVRAIREHPLLGAGSESVVDQAFSDDEILEELEREGIKTVSAAIRHFAIWDGIEVDDLIDVEEEYDFVYDDDDEEEDFDPPIWWRDWDDHTKKVDW